MALEVSEGGEGNGYEQISESLHYTSVEHV